MKPSRSSGVMSDLAFLDIITCGFGAVILLLIISKPGLHDIGADALTPTRTPEAPQTQTTPRETSPAPPPEPMRVTPPETVQMMPREVPQTTPRETSPAPPPEVIHVTPPETVRVVPPETVQARPRVAARVEAIVTRLRALLETLQAQAFESGRDPALDGEVRRANQRLKDIQDRNAGLEQVRESLQRATIQTPAPAPARDPEVGGIPVDSEYVIFIIDTSGSMQGIWPQVIDTIGRVLDIHPTVRGFQVLNDNGAYLISAYKKKWIPDTPRRRKSILKVVRNWRAFSNSSPVEGLRVALRAYARQKEKVAVYIFGDDYSGQTYDQVLTALQDFNTDRITGNRKVRIHAVGFISAHGTARYATLMRAVTQANDGAFLALPVRGAAGVAQPTYGDGMLRNRGK